MNNYLQDNEYDLSRIYNAYSDNGRGDFTLTSAAKLFPADLVDAQTLKACFIYSAMTIQNESTKSKKYKWLLYVEFLELICRVSPFIP